MIVDAINAGKHAICEKPFAGYFGREADKVPIGKHVPKALMYERVLEEMETTRAAIKQTGKLFMYAEDWIYAPAVTKTVEILKATKDKILFMKADEGHSGSHAAHAAQWGDDRRWLPDPDGMSSAFGCALSQAGRGESTW
jgi:predicted dehydrogenase